MPIRVSFPFPTFLLDQRQISYIDSLLLGNLWIQWILQCQNLFVHITPKEPEIKKDETFEDPISLVPSEVFIYLVSFLSVHRIAQTSAVSKSWRETINGNPALWTEVDLSKSGVRYFNKRILSHLERFSNLSLKNLVKVNLNLTTFWRSTISKKELPAIELKNPLLFLVELESHLNIKELTLILECNEKRYRDATRFFEVLIDSVEGFPSLKVLHIRGPTGLGILSGREFDHPSLRTRAIPGSRSLEISNNFYGEPDASTYDTIIPTLQKVTKWTGKGLSEFSFDPSGANFSTEDEIFDVIDELRKSRSTLQVIESTLDLDLDKHILRDFSMNCPNLMSFNLKPSEESGSEHEAIRQVEYSSPDGRHPIGTHVELNNFNVHWDQVKNFLVNQSRDRLAVSLSPSRHGVIGPSLVSSGGLGAIIEGCSNNIKSLKLSGLTLNSPTINETPSYGVTCLPNLNELKLGDLEPKAFEILSALDLPQLEKLHVQCHSKDNQIAFNGMVKIFINHARKLKFVRVGFTYDFFGNRNEIKAPEALLKAFQSLGNLEMLHIDDGWGKECPEYFAKFSYPSLKRLGGKEIRWPGILESFKQSSPNLSDFDFQLSWEDFL